LEKLKDDADINVVNLLAFSLRYSEDTKATEILNTIFENYNEYEIVAKSVLESLKKDDSELKKLKERMAKVPNKKRNLAGYDTYKKLCIKCYGPDLMGAKNEDGSLITHPLIGSARVKGDKDVLIKILLKGLTGPIDGKDYGIMMSVSNNSDQWIADVASYIRGMNDESTLYHKDVRNVRRENNKEGYWTLKELEK
jgi:hypothetical protein